MTFASMSDAVKEMERLFREKWTPRPCDYVNQGFRIPPASETWARWRCQHFTGDQATLANVVGKRRWRRAGTIFVQVFTPLNESELLAYDAAEIVVSAYEGAASSVWFRNVRVNEVNSSDAGKDAQSWSQRNVLIDFEYEQIH